MTPKVLLTPEIIELMNSILKNINQHNYYKTHRKRMIKERVLFSITAVGPNKRGCFRAYEQGVREYCERILKEGEENTIKYFQEGI